MGKAIEEKFDRIVRNRLLQHILFWGLSFLVLTNILKVSATIQLIDLIYTATFHLCMVLPVYVNLLVLIPLFLAKRKFVLYSFCLSLNILAGIGFYFLMFNNLIDHLLSGYYFIAYYDFFDILLYLCIFLTLTTLLKLARAWFKLKRIENETSKNNLNALKAQVNPHFLFNTLSGIYSLARKKSDETPGVIMKLSEVLRYMLYETDVEKVPLEKEIGIIRNIIDIHRVRLGDAIDMELKITGNPSGVSIAPLIFIPFVENSFKHGKTNDENRYFIRIELEITPKQVRFLVINSKSTRESQLASELKATGIGLKNCSKRLSLLYPGRHTLSVQNGEHIFSVELMLKI